LFTGVGKHFIQVFLLLGKGFVKVSKIFVQAKNKFAALPYLHFKKFFPLKQKREGNLEPTGMKRVKNHLQSSRTSTLS